MILTVALWGLGRHAEALSDSQILSFQKVTLVSVQLIDRGLIKSKGRLSELHLILHHRCNGQSFSPAPLLPPLRRLQTVSPLPTSRQRSRSLLVDQSILCGALSVGLFY